MKSTQRQHQINNHKSIQRHWFVCWLVWIAGVEKAAINHISSFFSFQRQWKELKRNVGLCCSCCSANQQPTFIKFIFSWIWLKELVCCLLRWAGQPACRSFTSFIKLSVFLHSVHSLHCRSQWAGLISPIVFISFNNCLHQFLFMAAAALARSIQKKFILHFFNGLPSRVNLYFFQLTHSQQSTIRSWRSNVYNYCYNIFQQSLSFNPKKTKLF